MAGMATRTDVRCDAGDLENDWFYLQPTGIHFVILSAAKDLIASGFKVLPLHAAMRSFAALRMTGSVSARHALPDREHRVRSESRASETLTVRKNMITGSQDDTSLEHRS
jgi:hypothetical protein